MNLYVSPVPEKLVSDCGTIGWFGPPFTEINSLPPEKVTSTVRGRSRYIPLYTPTYFASVSGAAFTADFSASETLPTQCSCPLSENSLHTDSISSVSAANRARSGSDQALL